jgi:choline kinase
MHALILAAGVGNRLGELGGTPKSLLRIGERTLLARHLDALAACGISTVTLCVGYHATQIEDAAHHPDLQVSLVHNPRFRCGSALSLWCARAALRAADTVLLMDADVLYPPALLLRLVRSSHSNCLLFDAEFDPGDEPVKIGLAGRSVVEFRKKPDPAITLERSGESVGFFKFARRCAEAIAARCEEYVAADRLDEPYEEVLRDVFLSGGHAIGIEDITGTPWIEIDFPDDIIRARDEILPQLDA